MVRKNRQSKILVVEDEPLLCKAIKERLDHEGYWVESVLNGEAALRKTQKNSFDLIITDLQMPKFDGVELLAALLQIGFKGNVFVMSGFLNDETERVVRQLGVTVCIEKPIELEALVRLVASEFKNGTSPLVGLSVTGVAQLIELENKTCLLRVKGPGQNGDLVFLNGKLVNAITKTNIGNRAALEIFSWDASQMSFHQTLNLRRAKITKSLASLMLEATIKQDHCDNELASEAPVNPRNMDSRRKPIVSEPEVKAISIEMMEKWLKQLMDIDGALGASLVDFNLDKPLCVLGGNRVLDIKKAASGNASVVKAKMAVMASLNLPTNIEDILITLADQYHLIRPLKSPDSMFLYLALDRDESNLALARHQLMVVEMAFSKADTGKRLLDQEDNSQLGLAAE